MEKIQINTEDFNLAIATYNKYIIKGNYDSPVEAALSLYLDFFNLFISLLQILGIMKNNE